MIGISDLIGFCIAYILSGSAFLFLFRKEFPKKNNRQKGKNSPTKHPDNPSSPVPTINKTADNRKISDNTDNSIEKRKRNCGYPISSPLVILEQMKNKNSAKSDNNSNDRENYKQYPLMRCSKAFNLIPEDKGNCCDNNQSNKFKHAYYVFFSHMKRIIELLRRAVNHNGKEPSRWLS